MRLALRALTLAPTLARSHSPQAVAKYNRTEAPEVLQTARDFSLEKLQSALDSCPDDLAVPAAAALADHAAAEFEAGDMLTTPDVNRKMSALQEALREARQTILATESKDSGPDKVLKVEEDKYAEMQKLRRDKALSWLVRLQA